MRIFRELPETHTWNYDDVYGVTLGHPRWAIALEWHMHGRKIGWHQWKSWESDDYQWRFSICMKRLHITFTIMKCDVKEYYFRDGVR